MDVTGDFDFADEQSFVSAVESLIEADDGGVVVDLTGVDFIDSSGVRALMTLRARHGALVRIGALSAAALRVFTIAGVLEYLGSETPAS